MSAFNLRPVSDPSRSPSSTSPTPPPPPPPPSDPHKHSSSTSAAAMSRTRRPMSPTSLRDVDLTHVHDGELPPRKYPAPPTGHDLMALFPSAAPPTFPEMRPGPTSGYFQRQERAFFAQAGKEIVRFRLEVDVPNDPEPDGSNEKPGVREPGISRPRPTQAYPQLPPHPQHNLVPSSSTTTSTSPSTHYASSSSRPPRSGGPVTPVTTALFPAPAHPQPSSQPPPALHPAGSQRLGMGRTTPQDAGGPSAKVEPQADESREDPDESWRRPMPYAERRRAGKHTRRVFVRN